MQAPTGAEAPRVYFHGPPVHEFRPQNFSVPQTSSVEAPRLPPGISAPQIPSSQQSNTQLTQEQSQRPLQKLQQKQQRPKQRPPNTGAGPAPVSADGAAPAPQQARPPKAQKPPRQQRPPQNQPQQPASAAPAPAATSNAPPAATAPQQRPAQQQRPKQPKQHQRPDGPAPDGSAQPQQQPRQPRPPKQQRPPREPQQQQQQTADATAQQQQGSAQQPGQTQRHERPPKQQRQPKPPRQQQPQQSHQLQGAPTDAAPSSQQQGQQQQRQDRPPKQRPPKQQKQQRPQQNNRGPTPAPAANAAAQPESAPVATGNASPTAPATAAPVAAAAVNPLRYPRKPFNRADIKPNSTVLMVAEKPSIAKAIADVFAPGKVNSRSGVSQGIRVFEFQASFFGKPANFICTSVIGHVYSCDFTPEYQSWETTDPATLFKAPTRKEESNPKAHVTRHLQKEARGCDYIVLWLDCDREGENICFEVLDNTAGWLNSLKGQQIFRAKFSAVTSADIEKAMQNLTYPNENEALAVDARQELDLKVGVAFTRFQTRYFQGKYGDLDAALVSYGPCQTPTLGFCVARHDEIQTFEPKKFWSVTPTIETAKDGRIALSWEKGRTFSSEAATALRNHLLTHKWATLTAVDTKEGMKQRPLPLNTVGLLKVASQQLHLSPQTAMHIAERLYTSGFISYPRTESTVYPEHFDLVGALRIQLSNSMWSDYVRSLLSLGIEKPKGGVDMGDHPPITPTMSADNHTLTGDDWRVYEYIARHFIASLSPNCKYVKTHSRFEIGSEKFKCSGKKSTRPGFTLIMPWLEVQDKVLSGVEKVGEQFAVVDVKLDEGLTSPPDYLTESELISLMEKNGIGTDASIPVHINNICERNYVQVRGANRTLVPTKLGIALVHGYHKIDPELVLPTVRANIEKQIAHIARGEISYAAVLTQAIAEFSAKFDFFVKTISAMDELFEASFSRIESVESSKLRTKCGKCRRFMKFIPLKPTRLYCPTCEETYALPQNGAIKLYKELTCPLDGFELVLFSLGSGAKSYPVCPMCFNKPQIEGQIRGTGCNQCPHPTCAHAVTRWGIADCGTCEEGTMVLDPTSGPKWRLCCNLCNQMVHIAEGAHNIVPGKDQCEQCGSMFLEVDFNKNHIPPALGDKTKYVACMYCDELLSSLSSEAKSRMRHPMYNRGGKRGRGRGRGRRRGGH